MKDFLEFIARRLVDEPDGVEVREFQGTDSTLYELRVRDGQLGQIIGKQGRTLRAIRTILSGIATKEGKRVTLELME